MATHHVFDRSTRPRGLVKRAGFTLIELMVVVGIMIVITSMVLANYNKFGGITVLEQLGFDVALTVRQAQLSGIAVKRFNGSFASGFGVHFAVSSPDEYVLFADVDNNGTWNGSASSVVQSVSIQPGYKIVDLCYTPIGGGARVCNSSSGGGVQSMDIVFIRPEPDAIIGINGVYTFQNGTPIVGATQGSGRIELQSPKGDHMYVDIDGNGQVSVHSR